MQTLYENFWLIPFFPLIGFLINAFFGKKLPKSAVGLVACGSVAISAVFAFGAIGHILSLPVEERGIHTSLFTWIAAGNFTVGFDFALDQLTSIMIGVVTGVGLLIHIYSIGYMSHEPHKHYARYFGYLNLFMFSMLVLVLGANFALLFIGWEMVGLCSYLLIGFYREKDWAGDAGKKAFVVNRVGDFGFALAMFGIVAVFGTLDFRQIFDAIHHNAQVVPWFTGGQAMTVAQALATPTSICGMTLSTVICLGLFLGVTGKSAQIPLYVWLPDAMAGPTPVSALIHAATMVTAGVYLLARCNALFLTSPTAMAVVAVVGALTAFFAASIGLVQNDIKKVLAYSTVSQLGYMTLACGVGAFHAGIFHLMTHAFFKALLFLGSGSVIHAMSGEQDIKKMGALGGKIKITCITMWVGTLAIAGIPGLAGFFSKDEILAKAAESSLAGVVYTLGLLAALMTAFYMFRMMLLTFHGESRVSKEAAHHLHESPAVMTVPLMILAVLSAIGGYVGIPNVMIEGGNRFEAYLEPIFEAGHHAAEAGHHASVAMEWGLMGLSVAIALIGIAMAFLFYAVNPGLKENVKKALGPVYDALLNKWYVDEIYTFLIVNPGKWFSDQVLFKIGDGILIEGAVNGMAIAIAAVGKAIRYLQTGVVVNYALLFTLGVALLVGLLIK